MAFKRGQSPPPHSLPRTTVLDGPYVAAEGGRLERMGRSGRRRRVNLGREGEGSFGRASAKALDKWFRSHGVDGEAGETDDEEEERAGSS
ncbi:hypothetical protein CUMW_280770 [Citrus unshiu]|uniref:Uncharacterized protein n=1 Tax=Citrus unshiu TaxID=55188 RepID=A0A2H5MV43_CITUN|nr:hypothetical protein CUMW_280770 [Citrus unshiu]